MDASAPALPIAKIEVVVKELQTPREQIKLQVYLDSIKWTSRTSCFGVPSDALLVLVDHRRATRLTGRRSSIGLVLDALSGSDPW